MDEKTLQKLKLSPAEREEAMKYWRQYVERHEATIQLLERELEATGVLTWDEFEKEFPEPAVEFLAQARQPVERFIFEVRRGHLPHALAPDGEAWDYVTDGPWRRL